MTSPSPDLHYPIGPCVHTGVLGGETRNQRIQMLAQTPAVFRRTTERLSVEQLLTPYRHGGWTVAQVVHHMADSHLNGYVRCRLALTEDDPLVRTYEEARWAELSDASGTDIFVSLILLETLHQRWVSLLGGLAAEQWRRTFRHPEWGTVTLDYLLEEYSWHGEHHLTHITRLIEREGW